MKFQLLIVLFGLAALTTTAQTKTDLTQLNFMSGKWTGSMAWGDMEEYWSEAMGDNMVCAFRCVKDGKTVFYEFIVIEQSESGVPTMKLRHFGRGNIAWEEKDKPYEYPLVKLEKNKAVFESADNKTRLIYERIDANQLRAVLEREKNGKWEVDEFLYRLSKQ
ncbi:MAG: hypothetical protein JNK44_03010 [Cyclobacteriaceae bacterium]|nr:hypothetical protein [Cyclobacteriaceae bacterium]